MSHDGFLTILTDINIFDSPAQSFISEEGVPNARGSVLGGSSVINAGFYSRADKKLFDNLSLYWGLTNVNQSYEWVERAIVFRLQLRTWQFAIRDALVENCVHPFDVGNIPIKDGVGKEVITPISSSLKSDKIFYTNSSGRDYIKRIRDYWSDWKLEVNQPVAGNYYPINHGIYLQDSHKELSVMVDKAIGGSSIVDGQVELMLHRRLLLDDSRGVAESLNETVCVQDKCTGLTVRTDVTKLSTFCFSLSKLQFSKIISFLL